MSMRILNQSDSDMLRSKRLGSNRYYPRPDTGHLHFVLTHVVAYNRSVFGEHVRSFVGNSDISRVRAMIERHSGRMCDL